MSRHVTPRDVLIGTVVIAALYFWIGTGQSPHVLRAYDWLYRKLRGYP